MKKILILFLICFLAIALFLIYYPEKSERVTLTKASQTSAAYIGLGLNGNFNDYEISKKDKNPTPLSPSSESLNSKSKISPSQLLYDCESKELMNKETLHILERSNPEEISKTLGIDKNALTTQIFQGEQTWNSIKQIEITINKDNRDDKIIEILPYIKAQMENQNNLAKSIVSQLSPENPQSYYIAQRLATDLISLRGNWDIFLPCSYNETPNCNKLKNELKNSVDPYIVNFSNSISDAEDIYFYNTKKDPDNYNDNYVCSSDIKNARLVIENKFSKLYEEKKEQEQKDASKSPFSS